MVIAHNMSAMNARRQFGIVNTQKQKSTERLASGYRINRAADNAAGLTISEKMRAQIRGLNRGARNIQEGVNLIQVADGVLSEVGDMLHRMHELAVQSANDTNTDADRNAIQKEIDELVNEIDRIGKTTNYNGMLLFDDMFGLDVGGSVTNLVSSPAANTGYLTEAIQVGSKWFPSASIDFSNISSRNINKLNGQGFSFCCSQNCSEVFEIKFTTDGRPSSATNLNGAVTHHYSVDISGCTSGTEVVNRIYNYVQAHPTSGSPSSGANQLPGALTVSHSNYLVKSSDSKKLIIYANWGNYPTEADAKAFYPRPGAGMTNSGKIDCSALTSITDNDKVNEVNIQCSGNRTDNETIIIHRMNATLLGINGLNVSTATGASNAITTVQKAGEKVTQYRSEMGAMQNRLEHSYDNVCNTEENTQSSESRIRDADMAKEMVRYSIKNILEQVGVSMMSHANQNSQGILALLQ